MILEHFGKKSADFLAILIGCGTLLSLGIAVPPMYLLFCQCFQQFNQRHSIIQVILQDLHFVWCVFQLLIYPVGECLLLHIYPYWVGAIYALTILLHRGGGHPKKAYECLVQLCAWRITVQMKSCIWHVFGCLFSYNYTQEIGMVTFILVFPWLFCLYVIRLNNSHTVL